MEGKPNGDTLDRYNAAGRAVLIAAYPEKEKQKVVLQSFATAISRYRTDKGLPAKRAAGGGRKAKESKGDATETPTTPLAICEAAWKIIVENLVKVGPSERATLRNRMMALLLPSSVALQ